jgi:tight adherence protein B
LSIIITFLTLTILCGGAAIIIHIRSKRPTVTTILDGDKDKDFIDLAIGKKKKKLASRPWGMKFNTYVAIALGTGVTGGIIGYLTTKNYGLAALIAVTGFFAPEVVEAVRNSIESAKFEERYARSLRQISSSIKSGMSIRQAVSDVCDSPFIHDSIRDEFRQLDADLKVGLSVQEGFERFAGRVNSDDATDVAIAITMQNRVGGNSALVVETITRDINNRIMSRKEVKSLFAGASSTISMMDVVPMAIIGFIAMSSPQYLAPFFESVIMKILFWGLIVFMTAGSFVIRKSVSKMKKSCQ